MKKYRTGIVFVHGIQGSPGQFDFLIKQVPGDIHICNILLPGHGATVREFRKADMKLWLSAVRNECVKMQDECERLVFVGHSMGCLLGLLVEQEINPFSAMLLICCPFYIHPTLRYLRYGMAAVKRGEKSTDPFVTAAREANSVYAKCAVSYLFCIRPYTELLKLIRQVKKQRLQIPSNTLFCFSGSDEIVSKKSISYSQKCVGAETFLLPECGHNYFTPEAKTHLTGIILKMLEEN